MTAAIVLSAGLGTRLLPLTNELPKPLMPVGDRPVLSHVYDGLARAGLLPIVVNTHHRPADFEREIEAHTPDVHVVHEPAILGTAGGVSNAAVALGPSDVLIWNGDIIAPDLDIQALVERLQVGGADMVWVVEPLERGRGTVGLDEEGHVVRLRGETFGPEVSGANFLGIQAMRAGFRSSLPREGCLVADVALPHLRGGGRIRSFSFGGAWDDIGTPEALLRANQRWLDRRERDGWCAADARIESGVRLVGSLVGAGASVRGSGVLRECVVFPGAEVTAPEERVIVGRLAQVRLPAR